MTEHDSPRPLDEVLADVYARAARHRRRRLLSAMGVLIVALGTVGGALVASSDGPDRHVRTVPADSTPRAPTYEPRRMLVPGDLPDGYTVESWSEHPSPIATPAGLVHLFSTTGATVVDGISAIAVRIDPGSTPAPVNPDGPTLSVHGQPQRLLDDPLRGIRTLIVGVDGGTAALQSVGASNDDLVRVAESIRRSTGGYEVGYVPATMQRVAISTDDRKPVGLSRRLVLSGGSTGTIVVTTSESGATSIAQVMLDRIFTERATVRGHDAALLRPSEGASLLWVEDDGVHVTVESNEVSATDLVRFADEMAVLVGNEIDDYLAGLGPPDYSWMRRTAGPPLPRQTSRPALYGETVYRGTGALAWAHLAEQGNQKVVCPTGDGGSMCVPIDATVADFTWGSTVGNTAAITHHVQTPLSVTGVLFRYQSGRTLNVAPLRPFPEMRMKWSAAIDAPDDLLTGATVTYTDGRRRDVGPPPSNVARLSPTTTLPPLSPEGQALIADAIDRIREQVANGDLAAALATVRTFNEEHMAEFGRSAELQKLHGHLSGATWVDANTLEQRRHNLREIMKILDLPDLPIERVIPR